MATGSASAASNEGPSARELAEVSNVPVTDAEFQAIASKLAEPWKPLLTTVAAACGAPPGKNLVQPFPPEVAGVLAKDRSVVDAVVNCRPGDPRFATLHGRFESARVGGHWQSAQAKDEITILLDRPSALDESADVLDVKLDDGHGYSLVVAVHTSAASNERRSERGCSCV
jgi:hypothetical protein